MGKWFPQWLAHTTAPNVDPADRRRLDLVIYGTTPLGGALCCDATLVSPLTRTGQPQPRAAATDGAALRMAERRKRAAYPELSMGGAQRLVVLGTEVGGRWNEGALRLVRDLGPARPARPPSCCQGRLVAKVVVPVGSLSAAGRCCHSIGQYVVGAGLRQPGAWPRARPGSQLGRVVGTQPIAAAVGSRRPRHMLQTQKGPIKRKKCVFQFFVSDCRYAVLSDILDLSNASGILENITGSSQAAVLHQHGSSKLTRCHGWSFGSVSLRTADVEHPKQSENFAQPTSRNNEESAIKTASTGDM